MNGSETVNYIVENGCQQTFHGQLVIDVNRAPIGGSVTRNISRGSTETLSVNDLASDDEPLTIVDLHDNPIWVSIQPGGASIIAVAPTDAPSQEYRFTVTVQDPGTLTATASVDLIINNTAPTAVPDSYETTKTQESFTPMDNDFDAEPGQLCIQTINPPVGSLTPAACPNTVTLTLQHGVSNFSYNIRDVGGLISNTATITITSNNPPQLLPASGRTDGQPTVQIPLTVTDLDGDHLDVKCPNPPPGFNAVVLEDPAPPDRTHPGFDLVVTVPPEFNSNTNNTATISCRASDGIAPPDRADMTITVV
jgi:hypothetical protein